MRLKNLLYADLRELTFDFCVFYFKIELRLLNALLLLYKPNYAPISVSKNLGECERERKKAFLFLYSFYMICYYEFILHS